MSNTNNINIAVEIKPELENVYLVYGYILATIIKELSYQKQLKNSNPEQIKMFCSKIVIKQSQIF